MAAALVAVGLAAGAWLVLGPRLGPRTSRTLAQQEEGPCALFPPLDGALADWMSAWREPLPGLTCRDFVAAREEAPNATSPLPLPAGEVERLLAVAPAASRSPDGRRLVEVLSGQEPDSSVALVDLEAGTRRRLLHCGTPCGWTEAAWADASRLVVAGWSEHHPESGELRCAEGAPCTHVPTLTLVELEPELRIVEYRGPEAADGATFPR